MKRQETHHQPQYECNEPNGEDLIKGYKLLMEQHKCGFASCEFAVDDIPYFAIVTTKVDKSDDKVEFYPTVKITKVNG